MAGARAYNGLNGREIRQVILAEVASQLNGEARFSRDEPIESVTVAWTCQFQQAPAEPLSWSVSLTRTFRAPAGQRVKPLAFREPIRQAIEGHLGSDQRFAQHLAFPQVTWQWRMTFEGLGAPVNIVDDSPVVETRSTETVPTLRLAARPSDASVVDLTARATPAPPVDPVAQRREALLKELAALDGGFIGAESVITPAESSPLKIHAVTGTGLPITGGAAPSPGAGMAGSFGSGSDVAVFQRPDVVELGMEHPPVAAGGIGAPDAVRRAHGLPVPATVATKDGQIVDLPIGTF